MGRAKASLPLPDGATFLTRIVGTLHDADVDDVVVVVGHDARHVIEDFGRSSLPARFVENPLYEQGQVTSLIAGLRLVDRPGTMAALVTLVDIPLISAATVRAIVERYRETRAAVVRPVRGGRHGHPLLLDRSLFELMRRADPAAGAKPIVRQHASADGEVEVADEGAFLDVDTPDEYEALLRALAGRR